MITVYGIPNCDTVRKARKWLSANNIEFIFFDMRKDGLTGRIVNEWLKYVSLDELINRRGPSWRKLPEKQRDSLKKSNAAKLILAHPTIVKRPVIDNDGSFFVGFDEARYRKAFL
jgi:arsenate reductase